MLETTSNYSLFEILAKGGWVMLPLALCSLLGVAIILERLIWGPSKKKVIPATLYNELLALINDGRFAEASGRCKGSNAPIASIILIVLQNAQKTRKEIIDLAEIEGKKLALQLKKNVAVLGTIAAVSPLLGLLGTVFGMIKTFVVISQDGVGNAPALAGGISEALLTTAAGLTIAIPSLIFYRFFIHRTQALTLMLEDAASTVIDLLQTKKQRAATPDNKTTVNKVAALNETITTDS
jgi:biopolymer transport protein ExbB